MRASLSIRLAYAGAAAAILLTACGGGGGTSAQSTQQIVGTVMDGYIEGAKVCLDLNGNGACDSAEPTGTTTANGAYELNVGSTNTAGLNVIAEIPATAKDSDDAGKTLQSAGKSAYTMAAPAEKASVVTPLTTLVVGKVKTDNVTLAQASAQLITQLGLPEETNLYEDHIAKGNNAVHAAATQVAGALQQMQSAMDTSITGGDRWSQLQQARIALEKDAGSISKISSANLNLPSALASVATGQLFAYKMIGATGKQINATALLFKPKTAMPTNGWPLVVFGHGTTGVGQQCAPSVSLVTSGTFPYSDLIATIVARGAVVVAPDYEGLGAAEMGVTAGHPYTDLRSAGQSMALAAVAARKILTNNLSGAWATVGHSQGGHAALAGAQFSGLATQLDAGLSYKGAVAVAPGSNLLDSFNTMSALVNSATAATFASAYTAVGVSSGYAAYVIKGTQSTPRPVSAPSILGSRILNLYNTYAESKCGDDFDALVSNDVTTFAQTSGALPKNYPGVIISAVNTPQIAGLLDANEPGRMKLPGKTLIVQGSADTTVLPAMTDKLVATMKAKGSDVTLNYQDSPSATHSGVLYFSAAQTAIALHLTTLFTTSK